MLDDLKRYIENRKERSRDFAEGFETGSAQFKGHGSNVTPRSWRVYMESTSSMRTEDGDNAVAQAQLKELLDRVEAGVRITLRENEKPVARLVRVSQRVAGLHAGSIWTSEDFNEPLGGNF
jgi:antitoxin (DNA-binding transcriptional repressor) of toxin-antitoxin stability system